MSSIGWFLAGGAVAYFVFGYKGGVKLSARIGAGPSFGGSQDYSYLGKQDPAPYQPLGTVGGFPSADFGFGGYLGFGGGGVPGGGYSYAQQAPDVSNGAFDPNGITQAGQYDGCLSGAKA